MGFSLRKEKDGTPQKAKDSGDPQPVSGRSSRMGRAIRRVHHSRSELANGRDDLRLGRAARDRRDGLAICSSLTLFLSSF